jgi:hypothetical protein
MSWLAVKVFTTSWLAVKVFAISWLCLKIFSILRLAVEVFGMSWLVVKVFAVPWLAVITFRISWLGHRIPFPKERPCYIDLDALQKNCFGDQIYVHLWNLFYYKHICSAASYFLSAVFPEDLILVILFIVPHHTSGILPSVGPSPNVLLCFVILL